MEPGTTHTLWAMHLWSADWACVLVQSDAGHWRAEVYRDGTLAAWYHAPAEEPVKVWAEALRRALAEGQQAD
jgi:hypothetical protein